MRTSSVIIAVLVAALALSGVLLAFTFDDDPPARLGATAPIAPAGVTLLPSCATDAPTQGVEATEDRTVTLPLPPPRQFPPASAERALAEFMDAWHDRAFDRMALWTTPSWRQLAPDAADLGALLHRRYGAFRLLGWTIRNAGGGEAVQRLPVLVAYRDVSPRVQRERLTFVLNRENADGQLVREGGRWGVFLTAAPAGRPSGVPADPCSRADA